MRKLILSPQFSSRLSGISVTLSAPDDVNLEELATKAQQAADRVGPAPEIRWANLSGTVPLVFLNQKLEIPSEAIAPPCVCVAKREDLTVDDALLLNLVSGSVAIDIKKAGIRAELLDALWTPAIHPRFGEPERLLLAANGLHLETALPDEKYRFCLIQGTRLLPAPRTGATRLIWTQVAWGDGSRNASHKNPADRLTELREASDRRLQRGSDDQKDRDSPIRRVRQFDRPSENDGAVYLELQRQVGATESEVRERVTPTWALTLGKADWKPKSLTVIGNDLETAVLRYTDGNDPFVELDADIGNRTSLEWNWDNGTPATKQPVRPLLTELDSALPILSTGELPGAGANSPFLWQMGQLAIGDGAARINEPGVWIRYRVDQLPEREGARSRQSDFDANLSRALQFDQLQTRDETIEAWKLTLGLLPDDRSNSAQPTSGASRIWLDLQPIDSDKHRVTLTLLEARIRIASPPIRALRTPLPDPEAVPNLANPFAALHPGARIVFANDRVEPTSVLGAERSLQIVYQSDTGRLKLQTWVALPDALVAYIPGPVAGLDLISRSRGNLAPTADNRPNTAATPNRVREFIPGRVAVHLLRNITLEAQGKLAEGGNAASDAAGDSSGLVSTIQIQSSSDLMMPRSEAIAALLPWAMSYVKPNQFDQHELQPYHRNLILDALDWALSAPDRHDPQPADVPPFIDPIEDSDQGEQEVDKPRDFRRDEALWDLARAVRDRFAAATASPFSVANPTPQPLTNWLPGVTFKSETNRITPQITLKTTPDAEPLTALPALEFVWEDSAALPAQTLALVPSPAEFTSVVQPDWLTAWLRWNDENSNLPQLQVDRDGHSGARCAASSDVPLLEQRTPIVAVAAGHRAGRQWIIFATRSPQHQLFAWEPRSGTEPEPLQIALENRAIDALTLDSQGDTLFVAIVQQSRCTIVRLTHGGADGIGTVSPLDSITVPAPDRITVARLAAQCLWIGTENTLRVYSLSSGSPVEIFRETLGTVQALDVRSGAIADKISLTVAVATEQGEIKLYGWETLPITGTPTLSPTSATARSSVFKVKDFRSNETITAVVVQPLHLVPTSSADNTHGEPVPHVFLYALVQIQDGSSRVVSWSASPIESINLLANPRRRSPIESSDDRSLKTWMPAVANLLSDPMQGSRTSAAQLLVAVAPAAPDGQTSLKTWLVRTWHDQKQVSMAAIPDLRPQFNSPIQFSGHEGTINAIALIPGRNQSATAAANLSEPNFAAWIVTGGEDGTVRVWDPETGCERFRHTQTSNALWLDTLGVVRRKFQSPQKITQPTEAPVEEEVSGFWVYPVNVPSLGDSEELSRRTLLALSTVGKPCALLNDAGSDSVMRFLCQDLHLEGSDEGWAPVQFNNWKTHTLRHGIFGCDDGTGKPPKLGGVRIEVIGLKEITFLNKDGSDLTSGMIAAQSVIPETIVFEAILSNPAEPEPTGETVPVFTQEIATIRLHLQWNQITAKYEVSLKDSHFDWRFPLTKQLPSVNESVLPGRLARLSGTVILDENRQLQLLLPRPKADESPVQAEVLGRLRPVLDCPKALIFDPGTPGVIRFRESLDDSQQTLQPLGNALPVPSISGQSSDPLVATAIDRAPSGEAIVLLSSQATDPDTQGAAAIADLKTGKIRTRFGDGCRRIQLVVDRVNKNKERITAVGIAEDGTVRIQRLWDIKQKPEITEETVEADLQEYIRYALPSPAEDVQIFKVEGQPLRLWLLARCRDGSTWLWDSVNDSIKYDLSLVDTAVTEICFSPPIPASVSNTNDENYAKFQPWRDFFRPVADMIGAIDTIVATGGADGSIRLYAVIQDVQPVLLRSLPLLKEPVQSLSLAIDKESQEALTLGRRDDDTLDGLVLLACDGSSPASLIEVLSGVALTENLEGDLPKTLGPETSALIGKVVFFDGVGGGLQIVLKTSAKRTVKLANLRKVVTNKRNRFDVGSDLTPAEIDPQSVTDFILTQTESVCLILVAEDQGWCAYRLANGFEFLRTEKQAIRSAACCEVFGLKSRYLLTTRPNGAIQTWKQSEPRSNAGEWQKINSTLERPARISTAVMGQTIVPAIACRGVEGQLGCIWDTDLGMAGMALPATLGLIGNEPVALAAVRGVPHLAIARFNNVTVWNLATGQLVYRLGLNQPAKTIELAADRDQLWLLVGEVDQNDDQIVYHLSNLSHPGVLVGDSVVTGIRKDLDARLVALPSGLHLVTILRQTTTNPAIATPFTLKVTVFHLKEVNGSLSITSSEQLFSYEQDGTLTLLDVIVSPDKTLWVLAHHTIQPEEIQPFVVKFDKNALNESTVDGNPIIPLSSSELAPVIAAFDLDPDPTTIQRPRIWTVDRNWAQITLWRLSDTLVPEEVQGRSIKESGRPSGVSASERPVDLRAVWDNGYTRLVGVSENGVAIWNVDAKSDKEDRTVIRTGRLNRAIPRIVLLTLSAVVTVDAEAGCVRFWDQQGGRLRQRLYLESNGVTAPNQLTIVPTLARPRLVVAGNQKVVLYDLQTGRVIDQKNIALTSLSATLMASDPANPDQLDRLVVAGIAGTVAVIWRSPLGEDRTLFNHALDLSTLPENPQSLELLRFSERTLLGLVVSQQLNIFDLRTDLSAKALATWTVPTGFEITTVRLAPALDEDCVLAAVALRAATTARTQVVLLDLPLTKTTPGGAVERPMTAWRKSNPSPGPIALLCDADGPCVVAGRETLHPGLLLRLFGEVFTGGQAANNQKALANKAPQYDLPVMLLAARNAFLQGRITPSRRLDLQIALQNPQKLGLPEDGSIGSLTRLTARASLIQGPYSCFRIDVIDRADFRLSGAVVLWENLAAAGRSLEGILLLEDTNLDCEAQIELPKQDGSISTLKASGSRVRLRAVPFDARSATVDALSWREVLSWYLEGGRGNQLTTEWHLADAVLDVPAAQSIPQVVKALLALSNSRSIQGNLLVNLQRQINPGERELYRLVVIPTVYAAKLFDPPTTRTDDTTRNDFVYPSGAEGPVGQAFDLVALPETQFRQADLPENRSHQAELFRLATLLLGDHNATKLLAVSSDLLPLDLNTGVTTARSLPTHSIHVPQLIHREAHGARIRGHWPPVFKLLDPQNANALGEELEAGHWLLSPIAITPQGAMALTLDLLIQSKGRPLNWTRLQTEGLLAIHREGNALFTPSFDMPMDTATTPQGPSVNNLLTSTVLRSSGAIGWSEIAMLDDERVQSYALQTGTTGVLLVRTLDARGRSTYRFVNSPYHSLVPLAVKSEGANNEQLVADQGETLSTDPRLLPPSQLAQLQLQATPSYQPVTVSANAFSSQDRFNARGFQLMGQPHNDDNDDDDRHGVYLSEILTVPATEAPQQPMQQNAIVNGQDNSLVTFLPTTIELGFGLTKPGGMFHQVIQYWGMTLDDQRRSASPTVLARREPQHFAPPPRSAINFNKPTLVQIKDRIEAKIGWTEALGSVSIQTNELVKEVEDSDKKAFDIKPKEDNADPPNFEVIVHDGFKADRNVLKWIVRLGEKVEIFDEETQLPIPITPFQNGSSVDAFDLFWVTRIKLGEPVNGFTPMLVLANGQSLVGSPLNLNLGSDNGLLESVVQSDGYYVWRLNRQGSQPTKFLTWLKNGLINQDINLIKLNLIWWNSETIDDNTYATRIPKLYPRGGWSLRDVPYEPQSPRLAAVLRFPEAIGPGLLTPIREFTLFDGLSASAKGVTPSLTLTNEQVRVEFTAQDEETVTVGSSLSEEPIDCGLFVVKYFEDGATLMTSDVLRIS